MVTVLLCLCVCLLLVHGDQLNLNEGDICKKQNGEDWTCKKISQCSEAVEDLKNGIKPETCGFEGLEAIVCCRPKFTPETTLKPQNELPKRISATKCEEFGKSVFKREIFTKLWYSPIPGEKDFDICSWDRFQGPTFFPDNIAPPMKYPHMALIGFGEKDDIHWKCTGSLISRRFVLSAAQCAQLGSSHPAAARWVRLGDHDAASKEDDARFVGRSQEYEITQIISHPEFTGKPPYNDIALYKLGSEVEFNEYIRPICLQTNLQKDASPIRITWFLPVVFTGETDSYLQQLPYSFVGTAECNKLFPPEYLENGINETTVVCASPGNTWDSCTQGHTSPGSSLLVPLQQPHCMHRLVGVNSLTYKECPSANSVPEVYTRVSHYLSWIESIVWP